MASGAQLSVPELRRAARHTVDYSVIAEHRSRSDLSLHIINISAHGFLIDGAPELERGERVIIRLPEVGRIEGYVIWMQGERAGFQFERIIRLDVFFDMLKVLQPNTRTRTRR